jgi:hypothetical protein
MATSPLQRKIKTFNNPILSIWQYALHKAISQRVPNADLSSTQPEMTQFVSAADALTKGQAMPQVDSAGSVIGECAKLAAEYAWAEITRNTLKASEIEDELKYSTCDPVWSTALAIYLAWKASLDAIPYVRYKDLSDFIVPLPDKPDLTLGLIADWGTGLDDAKWLLSEVMKKNPDVLIHLGDIYYAGTADDDRDHFLKLVNEAAPGVPVYTLSGNHDMYSGGEPFYWLLGQLNQSPGLRQFSQPASYFCLRSENWQLLVMDTGLHDCDPFTVQTNLTFLDPKEADWHIDKLTNAGGRRTILFSHHQLFTAFGDGVGVGPNGAKLACNPNLLSVFGPHLNDVALWLWGHEHNLEIFNPYLGLAKGRCIGASAIPVLAAQNPYAPNPALDLQGQSDLPSLDPRVTFLNVNPQGIYFHNYAIMELHSPASEIKVSSIQYYQLDASNHGPSILTFGEDI